MTVRELQELLQRRDADREILMRFQGEYWRIWIRVEKCQEWPHYALKTDPLEPMGKESSPEGECGSNELA